MDIVLVTALCNHTFRLPQVILDVGVELDGFGPAVAEDGLTDVLFAGLGCSFLLLHFFGDFMIIGAKVVKKCDTKKSFHINFLINYSFVHISG